MDIEGLKKRLRAGRFSLDEVAPLAAKAADAIESLQRENEQLQRVIDSRPAINAGLPESYIKWSHSIYAMDMAKGETPQ